MSYLSGKTCYFDIENSLLNFQTYLPLNINSMHSVAPLNSAILIKLNFPVRIKKKSPAICTIAVKTVVNVVSFCLPIAPNAGQIGN